MVIMAIPVGVLGQYVFTLTLSWVIYYPYQLQKLYLHLTQSCRRNYRLLYRPRQCSDGIYCYPWPTDRLAYDDHHPL